METAATDLRPGRIRVFALVGVGGLVPMRWGDLPADSPQLEGWLAAGYVSETSPSGGSAPAHLRRCCGSRS